MSNTVNPRPGNHARQGPAPQPPLPSHRIAASPLHRSPRRRGSALMVALALLMMLAVFAALFLTSSRFDMDAATADLDAVRMDLYAEGLFQYVQSCMVAGLWGFDTTPANYDESEPAPVPPLRTPRPGLTLANCPGPDAPFTYFGGRVLVDPDQSTTGSPPAFGDEYYYYPNFWLTDPRVQTYVDPTLVGAPDRYTIHPAFGVADDPTGLPNTAALGNFRATFAPYFDNTYSTNPRAQWRFADMNGDGRADTPWLFQKSLGNGLYMRVAIRVEDTSSRINVNVANQPLFVSGLNNPADPYPRGGDIGAPVPQLSEAENLLRTSIFAGYPWIGLCIPPIAGTSEICAANSRLPMFRPDPAGYFISELDLQGAIANWAQRPTPMGLGDTLASAWARAGLLNDGNGTLPGRFQTVAGALPSLPDAMYAVKTTPTVPPPLAQFLGDPDKGDPGQLGRVLEPRIPGPLPAGISWDPAAVAGGDPANPARCRTWDPDGLARRLENRRMMPAGATYQLDHVLPLQDTFDLMSLQGQTVAANPSLNDLRYRSGGSLPSTSQVEALWSFLTTGTDQHPVQWRKLLTTYSWALSLCPYGEHPYDKNHPPANPDKIATYRKLDLNDPKCKEENFREAVLSANRHAFCDPANQLTGDDLERFVASFVDYRSVPFDATQIVSFLRRRQVDPATPLPANWDPLLWVQATLPSETAYLNTMFGANWSLNADHHTFWHLMNDLVKSGIQSQAPTVSSAGYLSMGRHPFITEVYMFARYTAVDPLAVPPTFGVREPYAPGVAANRTSANDYAIELYNPWDTAICLTGWSIRVNGGAKPGTVPLDDPGLVIAGMPPNLKGVPIIPPYGRVVVTRFSGLVSGPAEIAVKAIGDTPAAAPDLVLAANPGDPVPSIDLIYTAPTGESAIYDNVPGDWMAEFNGTTPQPWDIVRRDNNGFWCYQRWAPQYDANAAGVIVETLGTPNNWVNAAGVRMLWDPWPVDPYTLGGATEGFGPNPAVPRLNGGLFLSPAELVLLPYSIPNQITPSRGGKTLADAITPFQRAADPMPGAAPANHAAGEWRYSNLKFVTPMLFHRKYTAAPVLPVAGLPANGYNDSADQNSQYAAVMQSLMDFVTTEDFTADGVDNDGNGSADGVTGAGAAELRMPGKLNLNTVADWYSLDQLSLLINIPASIGTLGNLPGLSDFWRRLLDYRDKRDPNANTASWFAGVLGRQNAIAAPAPAATRDSVDISHVPPVDRDAFLGFEQLGEICNIQSSAPVGGAPQYLRDCQVFWQNPVQGPQFYGLTTGNNPAGAYPYDPLLPQQYIRKFARNMNLLTTRSDTFMVTIRIEIVRATPGLDYVNDPANTLPSLRNIAVLGQREFMYLTDRSYCVQAPQQMPVGAADWGGPTNPNFNGRVNPAFVPPKVWRMTIPRYAAYGG